MRCRFSRNADIHPQRQSCCKNSRSGKIPNSLQGVGYFVLLPGSNWTQIGELHPIRTFSVGVPGRGVSLLLYADASSPGRGGFDGVKRRIGSAGCWVTDDVTVPCADVDCLLEEQRRLQPQHLTEIEEIGKIRENRRKNCAKSAIFPFFMG